MLTTVQALEDGHLADRRRGWVVTLTITALAFILRVTNLGYPRKVVFDETYYAKDGWSIMQSGYERNWGPESDEHVVDGIWQGYLQPEAEYVVHPPLGKQLIGLGEHLFGLGPFGWRFASCVFGALLVLFTIRLTRRLSRSTLVGGIAGILITFDGLSFVMSRVALLDIFQTTLAVAAVSALVADRDWFRHRLASHLRRRGRTDLDGHYGPLLLWRPWRLAAGILFGLSCAVKWNTIYLVATFGLLAVASDLMSRRVAGAGRRSWLSIPGDGIAAFLQIVVAAIPTYLATWLPWLLTDGGWGRTFGRDHPDDKVVRVLGEGLGSLWNFHVSMFQFHTGDYINRQTHTYDAHPWGWLLMIRPIGFDANNDIPAGTDGCSAVGTTCVRIISAAGTPVLWWSCAVALVLGVWWIIRQRDWRFVVPVVGVLAVWLPWFQYTDRPLFFFYAIVLVPFYVTGLALALGRLLGPTNHPRRRNRAMAVAVLIALVIANFAFMHPILTDGLLSRPAWLARMWLGTWI